METTSVSKLAKQGQGTVAKAFDRAAAQRGINALGGMVGQARDAATNATDSILSYTKKNPAKALGIAAVAGAILFAVAKANAMRRN